MQAVVFHAIILKSYETGNSSEVIHVISGDFGRLSVYARALRNPKNRYRGVLQPLSLVEITASLRDDSDLANLREATLLDDHAAVVGDLERFSLGLLLAELAAGSSGIHQPAPEVFAALLMALNRLDPRGARPAPEAACLGMIEILSAAGYEPQIDDELLRPWPKDKPRPVCFWLCVSEAMIGHGDGRSMVPVAWPSIPPFAAEEFPLPPEALRFLYEARRTGEPQPLDTPHALQLLEGLVRVAEHHLESPLRSATFWRSIAAPPR